VAPVCVLIVLEVLNVDGSCAKHLTVESYTVIYAANSHTYYYYYFLAHQHKACRLSFPPTTLSFIPDLKPSFSANPFHSSLSFSSSGLTFTVTSEHIRFYFLVFLFYTF